MGISEKYIKNTLASCLPPKGRMEQVNEGQPYMVLVDYAHTPDGLESVLRTLKTIAESRKGKLLVLFGCGGDRDQSKRPLMGKVASEIADQLVITDDNPRSEDGQEIIANIVGGINPEFNNYELKRDRKEAIEFIIDQSQDNDVVVLAGKGHETSQIIGSGAIHFDDREEAIKAISRHT